MNYSGALVKEINILDSKNDIGFAINERDMVVERFVQLLQACPNLENITPILIKIGNYVWKSSVRISST